MIIQWTDKRLNKKSVPVTDISIHASLIEEMKAIVTLRRAWGLSAVQVGIHERFCVVKYGSEIILLVNPEITKKSRQTCQYNEGCLSLADGKETRVTTRYKRVTVHFTKEDGFINRLKATGLLAACSTRLTTWMGSRSMTVKRGHDD